MTKIAFRQLRCAIRIIGVRFEYAALAPGIRQPARQRAHALDFVEIAAQARFVGYLLELREVLAQLFLLVHLPEEARIGKSRAQDALVARAYQSLAVFIQINDGDEMRRERTVLVRDAEIFLMITHHCEQNLIGQAQVSRIEIADDRRRVFVEIGDQFSELGIGVQAQSSF